MRIVVKDMDDARSRTLFAYYGAENGVVADYDGIPPATGETIHVRWTLPDLTTHVDTRWRVVTVRHEVQEHTTDLGGRDIDRFGHAVAVVLAVCMDPDKLPIRPPASG